jgi:hypothetical protein
LDSVGAARVLRANAADTANAVPPIRSARRLIDRPE